MDVFNNILKGQKHPMKARYHHLTAIERSQIYALKKQGIKQIEIAKTIGKSASCVSKELKRNKGSKGYRHKQAHKLAIDRREKASQSRSKRMTSTIKSLVLEYLMEDWSPVQISGYMKKHHSLMISHETIYKFIWDDKKNDGILYKHLRHSGKKYNKRSGKNAGRGLIPNRVDIKERPAIVDTKTRIGDFEIDTIIGLHHKGAIVSAVDKNSKYTKLRLVSSKSADEVTTALILSLDEYKGSIRTITADNGKEFANHREVSKHLNADFYFATPYHSWERGLNEHTNGLVRQYFPKKTDFAKLTQEDIDWVEKKLNSRPRKELNFETPENVFLTAFYNDQKISLHS